MNSIEKNIARVIKEVVEKKRFILIESIIRGTNSKRVFEVFIDGEKDISAKDCADTSREIDSGLEIILGVNANYRLDVSSPGIDKPLKFLKQYPKHVNRKFELSYQEGDETKKINAKLLKVDGEDLFFSSKNNEVKINFSQIKNAKVTVSFS